MRRRDFLKNTIFGALLLRFPPLLSAAEPPPEPKTFIAVDPAGPVPSSSAFVRIFAADGVLLAEVKMELTDGTFRGVEPGAIIGGGGVADQFAICGPSRKAVMRGTIGDGFHTLGDMVMDSTSLAYGGSVSISSAQIFGGVPNMAQHILEACHNPDITEAPPLGRGPIPTVSREIDLDYYSEQ